VEGGILLPSGVKRGEKGELPGLQVRKKKRESEGRARIFITKKKSEKEEKWDARVFAGP